MHLLSSSLVILFVGYGVHGQTGYSYNIPDKPLGGPEDSWSITSGDSGQPGSPTKPTRPWDPDFAKIPNRPTASTFSVTFDREHPATQDSTAFYGIQNTDHGWRDYPSSWTKNSNFAAVNKPEQPWETRSVPPPEPVGDVDIINEDQSGPQEWQGSSSLNGQLNFHEFDSSIRKPVQPEQHLSRPTPPRSYISKQGAQKPNSKPKVPKHGAQISSSNVEYPIPQDSTAFYGNKNTNQGWKDYPSSWNSNNNFPVDDKPEQPWETQSVQPPEPVGDVGTSNEGQSGPQEWQGAGSLNGQINSHKFDSSFRKLVQPVWNLSRPTPPHLYINKQGAQKPNKKPTVPKQGTQIGSFNVSPGAKPQYIKQAEQTSNILPFSQMYNSVAMLSNLPVTAQNTQILREHSDTIQAPKASQTNAQIQTKGQLSIAISQSAAHASLNKGDYSAIPGEPDVDYPILYKIPSTDFRCENQQYPGYYADAETRCQVFHICANDQTYDFLCPNGTVFHQEYLVCVWWNQFDCNTAPSLYGTNANIYDHTTQSSLQQADSFAQTNPSKIGSTLSNQRQSIATTYNPSKQSSSGTASGYSSV